MLGASINLAYLVLEQSFFHQQPVAYWMIKSFIILLLLACLPFTYRSFFQKYPLVYISILFMIHLVLDSTLFVLSGCHISYVSSYVISILFLTVMFPYNHRLSLGLTLTTIAAFDFCVGLAKVTGWLEPAQPLDSLFLFNQNFLLMVVGTMVFLKSFIEDRLKFREFIFQKRLEETKTRLQHSLSALKNTQVQLVQSEKMASMGRLVAGIAHELNNPINIIYGNLKPLERYTEYLRETAGEEMPKEFRPGCNRSRVFAELKDLISSLREGSMRLRDTIRDLLIFSRGTNPQDLSSSSETEIFDPLDGLKKTISLIRHWQNDFIEIEEYLEPLPMVEGNPSHLNQVFMNLMINAVQALSKKGGKISVKASSEIDEQDMSHVVISIRDNGSGIHPEDQSHIFEPFFTTKDEQHGTGLGLAISHSFIRSMDGSIHVRSYTDGPLKGSEFTITLPAVRNAMENMNLDESFQEAVL